LKFKKIKNNFLKQNFLPFFWSLKKNKKEKKNLEWSCSFFKLREEEENSSFEILKSREQHKERGKKKT
jgi:hypothetical protein